MWFDKRFRWLAVLALAVALVFRLPAFGSLPNGLNRDEASLGYNAWLISQTGRDEWQHMLPIRITSFGDEKLPGYVYALVPFLWFLQPTAFTLKLPSLLAGLIVVVTSGSLAGQLARNFFSGLGQKKMQHGEVAVAGLTMASLATSPWAIHFSRIAYEAHVALAFFLLGLDTILPIFLHTTSKKSERWRLLITAFFWSLCLTTYHSYHIFLIGVGLLLLTLGRKIIPRLDRTGLLGGLSIGAVMCLTLLFGGIWSANQQKISGISIMAPEKVWEQVALYRSGVPGENSLLDKLVSNSTWERVSLATTNWSKAIAPSGIFATIPTNHVHNVSGVSNLHLFLLPFVLLGLGLLWERRNTISAQVLGGWLFFATIAPTLTLDPQHTVRLSPLFPALEITAAFAGVWFLSQLKRYAQPVFLTLFLGVACLSIARWSIQYGILGPKTDTSWSHDRYHMLASLLATYAPNSEVITNGASSSPYIWYALLNKLPPKQFWETREAYPIDREGFRHIQRVGNVQFREIHWAKEEARYASSSAVFVLAPKDFPIEKRNDVRYQFLQQAEDSNHTVLWEVWRFAP